LIELVRAGNYAALDKVMSCGVSPNPCNQYGESLVHMVCRRGEAQPLGVLLKNGCQLQVADDYGRTPLHDACWAARPAFDVVEKILAYDVRLFYMTDCRGAVPLSYVRKEHWCLWIDFLESRKDQYWPGRDADRDGEEDPPALTLEQPNSRPIPDPANALTPELAAMVVSGKMTPDEAQMLKYDKDDAETANESDSDSDYDSDEDYTDSDDDDSEEEDDDEDDEDDFSLDEGEMVDILNSIALPSGKAMAW
jgi:hypothetical protein